MLLQAGLGNAKAISSKKDHKRFTGEVLDDETVHDNDTENDENVEKEDNQPKQWQYQKEIKQWISILQCKIEFIDEYSDNT